MGACSDTLRISSSTRDMFRSLWYLKDSYISSELEPPWKSSYKRRRFRYLIESQRYSSWYLCHWNTRMPEIHCDFSYCTLQSQMGGFAQILPGWKICDGLRIFTWSHTFSSLCPYNFDTHYRKCKGRLHSNRHIKYDWKQGWNWNQLQYRKIFTFVCFLSFGCWLKFGW